MSPRDWPIKRKLTAILVVVSGVVLLLTSAAFATYQVVALRRTAQNNLSTLGQVIAANATASLAFANQDDAREILAALKADPQVTAAGLYDKDGRLFAAYPAALPADSLPAGPEGDGFRFGQAYLVGTLPVAQASNTRLGSLYLRSDLRALHEALQLSGLIGAVVMAVALLAAYGLAAVLHGRISKPIVALATTARAVSEHRDYSVRAPRFGQDEFGALTDAFNHMLGRIEESEARFQRYAAELEDRVAERTRELEERNATLAASDEALRRNAAELLAANAELDAFAYSVSHDLRSPLRSIDGFSQVVLEDHAAQLDEAGREALQRVRGATQRMGMLIDDLLKLARVTRTEIRTETVDLSAMAQRIAAELQHAAPARQAEFVITPGLEARGDARLLRVALDNLLGNSWKYTAKRPRARIEFGTTDAPGERAFYVRDNGAGFDMQYADKLFGAFQRLHSAHEFEGTGVGLATVRRVIGRHGGRVWADGATDVGATFYFTL